MNDELSKTTMILRSPKVRTDERGRTVWVDTVKTATLELVSTQMLKQIIETGDVDTSVSLREVAEGEDGLLARDVDKGGFEIIGDEELQRILDGTDLETDANETARRVEESAAEVDAGDEELELVSTQMLRIMLSPEDEDQIVAGDAGFNPYDHS